MKPHARWILLLTASFVLAASATHTTMAADTTVTVANSAPTVTSVSLPGSAISPTSGSTTTVASTIVVEDLNGCSDLFGVTLQVLKPDGSTSHFAASAATYSSCSAGVAATYTHSFTMAFHDDPALSTSTYKVKVVATDSQGATGDNAASLAVFNFNELAALNLNLSTFDLGSSLSPGSTSSTLQLGVQNHGNVQIDLQLSGTALSHATEAATIPVSNLSYSTSSTMSGSSPLSTSAASLSTFDLAKGASSSQSLYWQLTVPSGSTQWVPSGTYTGTVTLSAMKG